MLIRYRVGMPLYSSSKPCKRCGQASDAFGDHASFCASGGFLVRRHDAVRDALAKECSGGGLQVIKEQRHLFDFSSERPADLRIFNIQQNTDLLVDVAVVSPLSSSSMRSSSKAMYASAEAMEDAKIRKYRQGLQGLEPSFQFTPFVLETFGGWTATVDYVIKRIAQSQAFNNDKPLSRCVSDIENHITGVVAQHTADMLLSNL